MADHSLAQDWLRDRARQVRPQISRVVALGLLQALLVICQAYLIATIIHGIVMGHAPQTLSAWFWSWLLVLAFRALVAGARERAAFAAGARVRRQVRQALLERLVALGPTRPLDASSGELSTTILERVEALEGYFAQYLPQRFLAALVPLVILLVVYPLNWAAGTLLLLTAPLIPLFMALIGKRAGSASERQFQTLGRMSGHFLDRLRGLATLKLLDRAEEELQQVREVAGNFRVYTMRVLRIAFLSSTVLEFFSAVAIAMVAVYLGMVLLGQISFGTILSVDLRLALFLLLLAPEFFLPLRQLGVFYHARAEALGAASAISELLALPVSEGVSGGAQLGPGPITVKFENVHLAYDQGRRPALRGASFCLGRGERVALVGPSGSGKSTVVSLLLGFLPLDSGTILINDQPLNSLDLADWRRHLAWIGQHPVLIHGTIRDNILFGRQAPEALLRRAVESVGVASFVDCLPAGLDTPVGEQGVGLSGGQAQRVALARALLLSPPLLILDEPTASLDTESEYWVLRALDALPEDCTVLLISHRLASIRSARRVLVMERGRVVESGDHQDLLDRSGIYQRLTGGLAASELGTEG